MEFKDLICGLERFGSSPIETCTSILGVKPGTVLERVILAPWWEPEIFDGFDEIRLLSQSEAQAVKVWEVRRSGVCATFIKTGIGAPVLMDVVLALGISHCRQVFFIGSVGALEEGTDIGDIIIPEYSICGDGASRYLTGKTLREDAFLDRVFPTFELTESLRSSAERICAAKQIKLHAGRIYSVDTVFAQFAYIDEVVSLGCNAIEMETAAAFRAARLAQLEITALLSVSDNVIQKKSLLSGRSQDEITCRKRIRKYVFPEIIWNTFTEKEGKEKR